MKRTLFFVFFILVGLRPAAQELNCRITILAPQLQQIDKVILDRMKDAMEEFMNARKWTDDQFMQDERIECNIQITLNEMPSAGNFKGSIQVQSSRPVYNSEYSAPILVVNDNDFVFRYVENQLMQWSLDQHRDNLTSVLAFYAYIIIGFDYDTFALEGGTDHLLKAQQIVLNAQNAGEPGWKASQGQRNRYWLIENHMHETFKPLRRGFYEWHRHGLDKIYENPGKARKVISDAIVAFKDVHQVRPASYNMQLFFLAKADEVVKLFGPAPEEERIPVVNTLKIIDPANIGKYDKMK
jgi:hypothetical protein